MMHESIRRAKNERSLRLFEIALKALYQTSLIAKLANSFSPDNASGFDTYLQHSKSSILLLLPT
jgi:hypothetical protein